MSNAFTGMMINVGFTFPPQNWAACDGQLQSIAQNNALYALLGTTYGGDGVTTFALPELRGRRALHSGTTPGLSTYAQGQRAGVEQVTLLQSNMPPHTHTPTFTNTSTVSALNTKGTTNTPATGLNLARGIDGDATPDAVPFIYAPASSSNQVALSGLNLAGTTTAINSIAGGSVPLNILNPYGTILTCMCLFGLFPSRN